MRGPVWRPEYITHQDAREQG